VPADWFSKTFNHASWPNASTYTEAQVGVNNKPAYTNFPAQFGGRGAQFIWSSNLVLDNEVIVRYTGPAAVQQIVVEQPSGTPLTDGTSTVAYGSVTIGSTSSKSFTIRNASTTAALNLTAETIDGPNGADFTVITPPAISIPASASTTMEVRFSPTSAGSKAAALHLASSDSSVGDAFDVNLTGTGSNPAPTITTARTSPNTPTYIDNVFVTAKLQAANGATITGGYLTYGNGSQSTGTVFAETMATSEVTPWNGIGANNLWTVTGTGNTIKQVTAANHGLGNPCGLQFDKGTVTIIDNSVTTTNPINAAGTAGYVEFWVNTTSLISPNGWIFQLSTDGATWSTRLGELAGNNHIFQQYHYDLLPSERVNTLRMRFQFAGYPAVAPTPAPKVNIDDITVVTTTGAPPVALTMFDDGQHGDALVGDGIYGALIPKLPAGTKVSYGITATDSNGGVTTLTTAGSYIVSATTPAANFVANAFAVGNNVTMQWLAQPGFSYSVQWSDDLAIWHDIPVGQVDTWTDFGALRTVPRRFYRVMR
jgi:hypothetical protein